MNKRYPLMLAWLDGLGYAQAEIKVASSDASFRQYFRLQTTAGSLIVMDCPPEQESLAGFVNIAKPMLAANLPVPEILALDLEQGFALLSDFGSQHYLDSLNGENADSLYQTALDALLQMQTGLGCEAIPAYDEALLRREMDLFHDWFLGQLLEISLNPAQQKLWQQSCEVLVANALQQPQLFVHRDYHSRNLMLLPEGACGIIDFQDAVCGPLTYDLVSLLRDCYIAWPAPLVEQWALAYLEQFQQLTGQSISADQFLSWFNGMGAQRHLKAVGIFARLKLRDGKGGYIKDIPRTLDYLLQESQAEANLAGLHELLQQLDLKPRVEALLPA